MGYLEGNYEVKKNDNIISIKLSLSEGWISVPNLFITKIILKPDSIFCSWSKSYEYESEINVKKKTIKSKWINKNIK